MVVKSLKVVSFWTIYGSCLDLTLTQEGHSVASSNDLKMENNVFPSPHCFHLLKQTTGDECFI